MKKCVAHLLTLMVDNEPGVLTRITAQIRREGWNIKSLSVAESQDPLVSRITLALECYDLTLPAVENKLSKLACVRSVNAFEEKNNICRELAVIRLFDRTDDMRTFVNASKASIVIDSGEDYVIEFVGTPEEVDAFTSSCEEFSKINCARTGAVILD